MLSTVEYTDKRSAVLGFIIERTAKRMKQACQQFLSQAGIDLTVDQWVLLQELHKLDGQGQNDLARKTFKDAPTVTRIIDLLCKKGLTERQVVPEDRRKFNVFLTPAGEEIVAEALPVIQDFRLQAYQNLSDTEMELLTKILDRIFESLQ